MIKTSGFPIGILILFLSIGSAAGHEIATEPSTPTATAPLRLVLTGQDACCGPEPRVFDRLELEPSTLRVVSRLDSTAVPAETPPPYLFTVDAGRLPAGTYSVEHASEEEGTITTLAVREVQVGPGALVRAIPDRPTSAGTFVVEVTAGATCPALGPVEVEGGEIRVGWTPGGCLGPPVFDPVVSEPVGPLPAGDYEIVVRFLGVGTQLAREPLTIFPDPVLLGGGRFAVEVSWTSDEASGPAQLVAAPSEDSALFWFFSPENWELMVKVLDGCEINGKYWVFAAGSTDVGVDLRVEDLETGDVWSSTSPTGTQFAPITDTSAFPGCV